MEQSARAPATGAPPDPGAAAPATIVAALTADAAGPDAERTRITALGEDGAIVASLDAREWDRGARAVAQALQQAGEVGERVVVPAMPGLDFHVAFLGCLYAGMVAVPVPDPSAGLRAGRGGGRRAERLATICADCDPCAVLLSDPTVELGDVRQAAQLAVRQPDPSPDWAPPDAAFDAETIALLQ